MGVQTSEGNDIFCCDCRYFDIPLFVLAGGDQHLCRAVQDDLDDSIDWSGLCLVQEDTLACERFDDNT